MLCLGCNAHRVPVRCQAPLSARFRIPYDVSHTPPENSTTHAFTNLMDDQGLHWIAPDRRGGAYGGGGDPSFYFVLDLRETRTMPNLRVKNCLFESDSQHYWVENYTISMSNDPTANFGPEEVTGTLKYIYTLQDVVVDLAGRYLKFEVNTHGAYSACLHYVGVGV